MKKLALVHKGWFLPSAVTDRWQCLFEAIRDECGFEVRFIEETKKAPAADVTLFSCAAGHLDDKGVLALYRSTKGKRIIYLADYQKQAKAKAAIGEADLVLAPEAAIYRAAFPGKRIEFFPYFFAPHERYTQLAWNDAPKMRCLVSGPVSANYPLRHAASRSPLADVLPHTGSHGADKKGAVVRDAYAERLNEYYCAVAGALRGGITTKAFEIQAAGALLITEKIPDLEEAGLWAWGNYIPADPWDIKEKIAEAVANKKMGDAIRCAGMEYARAKHGIRNRVAQFKTLTEAL